MSKPDQNLQPETASAADWAILEQSQPQDFDGHTEFAHMTPGARLRWLEQAAAFVLRYKSANTNPSTAALAEDAALYPAKPKQS